jgi:uncharacterized LabA/DUF88 family protein
LADTRLKIAVFIDFDNIEIGVKSTLGVQFDIGVVLEALKERGDVVSKIAYGDWTRAGDYSRSLTQHATKLVQRNLTPGGDKNGADINLALDALEMAFTHSHINAYVIVGGDSDFITLVEKLKQYDKQIFVVGGRAFTSLVMQRNCHEFVAYENLVGSRRSPDRGRQSGPVTQAPLDQVVPLVRRALKVLSDREVTPQLGLLKSTLLQLDSTFSERTYGAGSFRDFAEKLASAGHVLLRESGRNVLVELRENGQVTRDEPPPRSPQSVDEPRGGTPRASEAAPANGSGRAADGIREVRRLFQSATKAPRWPMYIRQVKQFLRGIDPTFDELRFGFGNLGDLMRACQREGLFRVERDRQGVMRVFPGNLGQPVQEPAAPPVDVQDLSDAAVEMSAAESIVTEWPTTPEPTGDTEVVEGDVVQEFERPPVVIDAETTPPEEPTRRGRGRRTGAPREPRAPRKQAAATPPRQSTGSGRNTHAKPRAGRPRQKPAPPPPSPE